MARTNRKWVLKSRPEVEVEQKHFALEEEPVAPVADGQVLLEHHYLTVNPPMRFQTADVRPRGPAPTLGQHSRSVLVRAGYSDGDIDRLLAAGVIGA